MWAQSLDFHRREELDHKPSQEVGGGGEKGAALLNVA